MKYYILLALFLVLGICRAFAQTRNDEPQKLFPNLKTEYQALKAKEQHANAADPNRTLDAAAKRQQLLGSTSPSAMKARKALPAAATVKPAGKNPSDMSSTEAEKIHAAKAAQRPPHVAPVLEQETVGGNKPVSGSKSTSTSKH